MNSRVQYVTQQLEVDAYSKILGAVACFGAYLDYGIMCNINEKSNAYLWRKKTNQRNTGAKRNGDSHAGDT